MCATKCSENEVVLRSEKVEWFQIIVANIPLVKETCCKQMTSLDAGLEFYLQGVLTWGKHVETVSHASSLSGTVYTILN